MYCRIKYDYLLWLSKICISILMLFSHLFYIQAVEAKSGLKELSAGSYVSLSVDRLNVREGPDKTRPIKWVYALKHLPVKVVEVDGEWVKIKDPFGSSGWVHVIFLSKKEYVINICKQTEIFSDESAQDISIIVGRGIILSLKKCNEDICFVSFYGGKGWIAKNCIWGSASLEKSIQQQ